MFLDTIVLLYPMSERDMGIDPESRTYEKVPAVINLNSVAMMYVSKEPSGGIPDATLVVLESGEAFEIQTPFAAATKAWKDAYNGKN